jgi:hypothetical protein
MSEPIDYSLLKAAALTNEELLKRLTAEMIALDTSGAGMRLDIGCPTAFAVVACVQLALRHPHANLGPSADLVRDFIEYVRAKFEPHAPAIALAIERGNDPQQNTPREPATQDEAAEQVMGKVHGALESVGLKRAAESRFDLPTNCYSCGAPLEGGATIHRTGCEMQDLIERAFPPRQAEPFVRVIEQEAKVEDAGISIRFRPNEPYRDLTPPRQAEPAEMEQERALLSRLLNSRDPLENARLTFGFDKHQIIFQRIMDLHERGEPVDRVALANELMKNGELQAIGGLAYLVTLYEPPQYDTPRQATRDPFDGFLNCPYCGFSQPAPLEKVDLYICGACGRTVDGGAPI